MINPGQAVASLIISNEEIWLQSHCYWVVVMSTIRHAGGDTVTQSPEMLRSLAMSYTGPDIIGIISQLVCNVIRT